MIGRSRTRRQRRRRRARRRGRDVAARHHRARSPRAGSVRRGRRRLAPGRLGDITILVPARTSLPFLEDALEAARIPYRAESSSLVYATRAVRDLLMVLRAVDDPTDHLRIVAALRTPLLGCGDDDLFRFKVLEGRTLVVQHAHATRPRRRRSSRAGLAYLRELHEQPPLARARRAARPHRPRPPRARARLRRGPAARRVAAAALRHRPGPGVERGHRRQPAAVPPLGRAADGRGRPGRRVACCPRPTTTPCAS